MFIYEKPGMESDPFFQPPFIKITQLGYLRRPLPWIQYPHIHDDEYEISYIVSGSGILNLPGCVLPLKADTIVIIPPQVAHCYAKGPDDDQELEYYVIRFRETSDTSMKTELYHQLQNLKTSYADSPEKVPLIKQLFDAVFHMSKEHTGKIDHFAQTMALSILQLTAEEFTSAGQKIDTFTPVYANDILRYLQKNVSRKVSMEELAQVFNLSQSHIFRVFMKTYHTSPINYLIYCRMREARTFILNQNMPPEEIAKRLSYKNVYHFTKTFESFYGCPPDKYMDLAPEFRQRT